MNLWRVLAASLICGMLLPACHRKETLGTPVSGPPEVGTLYSLNDGEGGFRSAKVIALGDGVVFVRLYAERRSSRPALSNAPKADDASSVAFSPETFAGMQPMEVKSGSVSEDELGAYEAWKQSSRDIF